MSLPNAAYQYVIKCIILKVKYIQLFIYEILTLKIIKFFRIFFLFLPFSLFIHVPVRGSEIYTHCNTQL